MLLRTEIAVGTKIWRPIAAHVKGPYIEAVEFYKTDRGQFMFKADSGRGHFTKEMVAFGATCRFGIACFIDEPPLGPWTHFEVMRVSRNGRSVQVRAIEGDSKELYAQYEDIGIRGELLHKAA